MNAEDLFRALDNVAEGKIEDAYNYCPHKKSLCKKYAKLAAAIIIFILPYVLFGDRAQYRNDTLSTEKTNASSLEGETGKKDMSLIVEKYRVLTYGNVEYSYTGNTADPSDIKQYLAEVIAHSSDNYGDKTACKIYSLAHTNSDELVAVLFDEVYYLYARSGEITDP